MAPAHRVETRDAELELADEVAACYADPLRFVLTMYDWPINGEPGPDAWQTAVLQELGAEVQKRPFDGVNAVPPIREAISSGHGIGKSALFAWLVDWLMSTRPHAQGTVTANTNDQLEKKTWAAIRSWTERCLTSHWFEINSQIMYRKGYRASWFCSPQSCAEENSEAFAGQHAKSSTSFYLLDEGSAIPKKIYEVAEGGLTDGAPMIIIAGNPTRNTGAFHEAIWGLRRDRWHTHIIDSRDCKLPNKSLIQEWLEDYGEDSDFFRVRVRGLPPRASELQFIDLERVRLAQVRDCGAFLDEPLVAGVDFSGGGAAWNVVRFRRGADANSKPPLRVTGEQTRGDRSAFLGMLAEILNDQRPEHRVSMMFCDSAFGAPYVERLRAMGFKHVQEVNFGTVLPKENRQYNQRAQMWYRLKEWLLSGSIPVDQRLEADLTGPGYHLNPKNQLVIESKESMQKRGVASPDDGDALALTFAAPVKVHSATHRTGLTAPLHGPMSWAG